MLAGKIFLIDIMGFYMLMQVTIIMRKDLCVATKQEFYTKIC